MAFPLREGDASSARCSCRAAPEAMLRRAQERIVPALESLLAAAQERDALSRDVVETRALRRSDVLKTALLRAVEPRPALAADRDRRRRREPLASPTTSTTATVVSSRAAIQDEAQRLSRLIDDLLDLSRLRGTPPSRAREWCSVDEVLRAAVDRRRSTTAGRSTSRSMATCRSSRADAAQLERAFANLLENAARHSGGHPVSLRARGRVGQLRRPRGGSRARASRSAQRERVFEPFYRPARRVGHRGSGLGLAIARGFVEANGGTIAAESLPGQGTTFVVEFRSSAGAGAAPA